MASICSTAGVICGAKNSIMHSVTLSKCYCWRRLHDMNMAAVCSTPVAHLDRHVWCIPEYQIFCFADLSKLVVFANFRVKEIYIASCFIKRNNFLLQWVFLSSAELDERQNNGPQLSEWYCVWRCLWLPSSPDRMTLKHQGLCRRHGPRGRCDDFLFQRPLWVEFSLCYRSFRTYFLPFIYFFSLFSLAYVFPTQQSQK